MTIGKRVDVQDIRKHFVADPGLCLEMLEQARWPHGVICTKCEHEEVWHEFSSSRKGQDRVRYVCKSCRHRFGLTTGTVFEQSHLGLDFWYTLAWKFIESGQRLRPSWIKKTFSVTYKTAWRARRATRREMSKDYFRRLLKLIRREVKELGGGKESADDIFPPEE
jgi:transposase-like protein